MSVESNKNTFECPYARVEPTAVRTLAYGELTGTEAYGVVECRAKCDLNTQILISAINVGKTSDSTIKMQAINQLNKAAATQIGRCGYNNGSLRPIGPDSPAS